MNWIIIYIGALLISGSIRNNIPDIIGMSAGITMILYMMKQVS